MSKKHKGITAFFLVLAFVISCMTTATAAGSNTNDEAVSVRAENVKVDSRVVVTVGESKKLTPVIESADAANKNVTWSSSNEDVATVSGGVVTAVAEGTATITVKTEDGSLGNCQVVVIPVPKVFNFDDDLQGVKAESKDYTVSKVSLGDEAGLLEVKFSGYEKDGDSFKLVMPTEDPDVAAYVASTHVKYDLILPKAAVNDPQNQNALFFPVIATPQNGWWQAYGRSDAFKITDMKPYLDGYYKITVSADITESTFGDKAYKSGVFYVQPAADQFVYAGPVYVDNIVFYTEPLAVESISLNKTDLQLSFGASEILVPSFAPAYSYNKKITWSSSDESKVTVDQNGKVTGIGESAKPVAITVTTEDGGKTAVCNVKVAPPILSKSITLDTASATLTAGWGKTQKINAAILPANVSNQTIIWKSSDETVAKVRNGVITAIGKGKAVITAETEDSGGSVFATCNVTIDPAPAVDLGDGSKKIKVSGNKFVVGPENKEIWMNGANTPWKNDGWDEFGKSATLDEAWWRQHFADLNAIGVNSTRVWLLCSGDYGIQFDEEGYCTGVSDNFWDNVGKLLEIAEDNGIYIMATTASFDCWLSNNHEKDTWKKWRLMIEDSDKIDSYVENYIIPLVNRFGSSDYLWSVDFCNEIDWIYEVRSSEDNQFQVQWDRISDFIARNAAGVRKNSDVLATVGMAYSKYCADWPTDGSSIGKGDKAAYEGNKISDQILASCITDEAVRPFAKLDFYSPHYYGWQAPWFGNPFAMSPKAYGYGDDRPVVIGETASIGSGWSHMHANESTNWQGVPSEGAVKLTLTDDYNQAMAYGYRGILAWTSNGIDSAGGFNDLKGATIDIANKHNDLVFPLGKATPPELTDSNKISLAKRALSFNMIKGDNVRGDNITVDLKLPATGLYNAVISWSSSNPEVLTNQGVVTRPAKKDVPVTLTAKITVGSQSDTVIFNLAVTADSSAIKVAYRFDSGTEAFEEDNGGSVGHAVLGNNGVLQVNKTFTDGDWWVFSKIKSPTVNSELHAQATQLQYDLLLPKAAVDANPNLKLTSLVVTNAANGWKNPGRPLDLTKKELVTYNGVEYDKITVAIDITSDMATLPRQQDPYLIIYLFVDEYTSTGPFYIDNVVFSRP